jgi:hypothetical protein
MSGQPYSPLGETLDELARKRRVRGPYEVAKHVEERTGVKFSGSAVSEYFRGESRPKVKQKGRASRLS